MRCNACWRELEERAVSTTCGQLLCTEDASMILSNDAACPICDQVLSMRWPWQGFVHKYGKRALELNVVRSVRPCKKKFTEKLEQLHTAYQKMAKRCQMMEQEIESLSKDKQELQEKFSEKSRQKRKLDEMHDQLRIEYESMKRLAIQRANNFFSRNESDFFQAQQLPRWITETLFVKIGQCSPLRLQSLGRMYGWQDRTVLIPAVVPLASPWFSSKTKQLFQLMLETEGVVFTLVLEVDLATHQRP